MWIVVGVVALAVGVALGWLLQSRRHEPSVPPAALPEALALPEPALAPQVQQPDELRRLRVALDALPIGVVYADATGKIVVRNRMAESAAGARHGRSEEHTSELQSH